MTLEEKEEAPLYSTLGPGAVHVLRTTNHITSVLTTKRHPAFPSDFGAKRMDSLCLLGTSVPTNIGGGVPHPCSYLT